MSASRKTSTTWKVPEEACSAANVVAEGQDKTSDSSKNSSIQNSGQKAPCGKTAQLSLAHLVEEMEDTRRRANSNEVRHFHVVPTLSPLLHPELTCDQLLDVHHSLESIHVGHPFYKLLNRFRNILSPFRNMTSMQPRESKIQDSETVVGDSTSALQIKYLPPDSRLDGLF